VKWRTVAGCTLVLIYCLLLCYKLPALVAALLYLLAMAKLVASYKGFVVLYIFCIGNKVNAAGKNNIPRAVIGL